MGSQLHWRDGTQDTATSLAFKVGSNKMRTIYASVCFLFSISAFGQSKYYGWPQEAALTDLRRCEIYSINYVKRGFTNLLIKAKDSLDFYHDQQIIILYNERKNRYLGANIIYIINHGFKRKVRIDMLYAEIENTGKKIKNIPDTTTLTTLLNWHYENDTLYHNSYASMRLFLPAGYYKKFKIKSCLLKIAYSDHVVYKWLLRNDEFKFYIRRT